MESTSVQQFCFWRHILIDSLGVEKSQGSYCPCSREILCETTATWQMTVKPLIQPEGFILNFFSPLDNFANVPLARFKPMRQRYTASCEANHLTDWAMRVPGMGSTEHFNSDTVLIDHRFKTKTDFNVQIVLIKKSQRLFILFKK